MYRGYKTVVLYADETAYGTGGTASTVIKGKLQTLSLNKSNNLIRVAGLGEGRNETFVGYGNFEGTWAIEYEVASFEFLKYGIGAIGGSGTTAAPYFLEEKDFMDYTSGDANGMKSFQMIVNSLDTTTHDKETVTGCVMNSIGLSLNIGETVKATVEGFFKSATNATTTTAFTADTTKPWIFSQGNFKWNGSIVARVTSATVNITNNFDGNVGRQIGSRFTEEAAPGLRKYDWVLVVKMTDTVATTLRDHFYGTVNTPNTGILSSEPTFYEVIFALSEGALTTNRNATILLSDCAINDISKPINIGDNTVELTINGTAKRGLTDTVNKPIKYWTTT